MAGGSSTKVVQITNIAPQATKDQLQQLFGLLGKIEEIRLYPSIRDVSVPVSSRICYVRFADSGSVAYAQHMTNTVFIDRALICIPVGSIIPDEFRALEMASNGTLVPGIGTYSVESKLPPEVVSKTEGQMPNQVIRTYDPKLEENNLPEYPALPVNFDDRKIEETRRTILVINPESDWRLDDLMDHFKRAGEVKYSRFAEWDRQRIAMIEFCEQKSVIYALKLQGTYFRGTALNLHHSTQPIVKPEAKSNEAAQKEIEEAMSIVKDCHNQISAVIDPAFGLLASKDKGSTSRRHSRSRSRSRDHRSRSRISHHSRSKRSRSRKRSPSRSRRKRSASRHKSRSRSRSRSNKRRKRSTSRRRKSRSRSKERRHRRKERSRSRHKRSSRNRSSRDRRTKSRERSRSRHRSEKKKKSHRSEKKEERKYSQSRSRSKTPVRKSPSRDKASSRSSKRRSPDRKLKKISEERVRDYDAEEKIGMDDNGCEKSDNMDISP